MIIRHCALIKSLSKALSIQIDIKITKYFSIIYNRDGKCGVTENQALYNLVQTNADTFLRHHPNCLVFIAF